MSEETVKPPRFVLIVAGKAGQPGQADLQILANEEGVTGFELVHTLVKLLAQINDMGGRVFLTPAQAQEQQRQADVLRDYPARGLHPITGAYLCLACCDLYGPLLEGVLVTLPKGTPAIACTYHLDERKAPIPFEDAAKIPEPVGYENPVFAGEPEGALVD